MDAVKKIDIGEAMWRDERGWGLNPFNAFRLTPEGGWDIHVVSLKPGAVRGNHYHTAGTEWMLICGGPARFLSRSKKEGKIKAMTADGTAPFLIEIPAHVKHAVRNDSAESVYVVVFNDVPSPETVRCPSLFD
jgi:oxalate decarboxylase/phosphoglucose isomerase-like protein (cupin superfamily)